jgi:hypothetical protein
MEPSSLLRRFFVDAARPTVDSVAVAWDMIFAVTGD